LLHITERPDSFKDLLGNKLLKDSMTMHLANPDRPHCYMLKGPKGVGKTTTARIMAKELGAMSIDIHEYNLAGKGGIDIAREITEIAGNMPLGTAQVIILDETQGATGKFQEAMLKPTEEANAWTYFFICTTAPSKILPTLRRRFTEYKVEPIDKPTLFKYIVKTAKKHDIIVTPDVVDVIVVKAEGSPALALVALDKLHGFDEVTQLKILEEEIASKTVIDLCRAFLYGESSWKAVIKIIKETTEDIEGMRHAILGYMCSVLLNPASTKFHRRAVVVVDMFSNMLYTKAEFVTACYLCVNK